MKGWRPFSCGSWEMLRPFPRCICPCPFHLGRGFVKEEADMGLCGPVPLFLQIPTMRGVRAPPSPEFLSFHYKMSSPLFLGMLRCPGRGRGHSFPCPPHLSFPVKDEKCLRECRMETRSCLKVLFAERWRGRRGQRASPTPGGRLVSSEHLRAQNFQLPLVAAASGTGFQS